MVWSFIYFCLFLRLVPLLGVGFLGVKFNHAPRLRCSAQLEFRPAEKPAETKSLAEYPWPIRREAREESR